MPTAANPGYIYHRLVVGYHGCGRATAERVLLGHEPLDPSENEYDWLGAGVYFWEHGYNRALEFAQWKQERGELDAPTVLGAYIHLGRCFDLTDTAATDVLAAHHQSFSEFMSAKGVAMPVNRQAGSGDFDLVLRDLDCAVLNFTLKHEVGFQTVRGVFVEGPPVYAGAQIHAKTHVQIAIRDASCILGYFLPPKPYNG